MHSREGDGVKCVLLDGFGVHIPPISRVNCDCTIALQLPHHWLCRAKPKVSAYFTSKQTLAFDFSEQNSSPTRAASDVFYT